MSDEVWHCRQLPNGSEPIVVCERDGLLERIAGLEAGILAVASVLVPALESGASTMTGFRMLRDLADSVSMEPQPTSHKEREAR